MTGNDTDNDNGVIMRESPVCNDTDNDNGVIICESPVCNGVQFFFRRFVGQNLEILFPVGRYCCCCRRLRVFCRALRTQSVARWHPSINSIHRRPHRRRRRRRFIRRRRFVRRRHRRHQR